MLERVKQRVPAKANTLEWDANSNVGRDVPLQELPEYDPAEVPVIDDKEVIDLGA